MPLILGTNSIKDTGYDVANSARFDGSNDTLNRTPSSAGNRKTWTWSGWIKFSDISSANRYITSGYVGSSNTGYFAWYFHTDSKLTIQGWTTNFLVTTQLFRDPTAWQHLVIALDTTQGTASNRLRVYLNGSEITSFSTDNRSSISQSSDLGYNGAGSHVIGGYQSTGSINAGWNGYLTEIAFIDGQQLDPTSFGEFDEDSGIWKPIDVSGLTFGTNGFYLDFENSGSLGADVSGNGNNFTVNNLTAIDSVSDVPTNNFATLNSLNTSTNITISEGNTKISTSTSGWMGSAGTIGITKGFPCYWEAKATTNTRIYFGLSRLEDYDPITGTTTEGQSNLDYMWRASSANLVYYRGSNQSVTVSAVSAGDILACSVDSSGNVKFYNNGSAIHTFSTVLVDGYFYFPILSVNGFTSTETMEANFGNPAFSISSGNTDANGYGNFEYAPPSNHYALNTKNLAEYG